MTLAGPARRPTVTLKVEAFLPQVDEPATEGLVVLDDVAAHRHTGRGGPR